jgi:maleate cis-trans isomerase
VLGTAGPGVVGELAKGRLGADAVTAAVLAAYRPGMDAVLVTGCTWPTVEGRAELERRTGVPVVSSTTAITWALLRRAGVTGALPDLGHLGTV